MSPRDAFEQPHLWILFTGFLGRIISRNYFKFKDFFRIPSKFGQKSLGFHQKFANFYTIPLKLIKIYKIIKDFLGFLWISMGFHQVYIENP